MEKGCVLAGSSYRSEIHIQSFVELRPRLGLQPVATATHNIWHACRRTAGLPRWLRIEANFTCPWLAFAEFDQHYGSDDG